MNEPTNPSDANQSSDSTPATAVHRGQGRILLMDDDATVRHVGKALLEQLNYEVAAVANGAEALACYIDAMESDRPYDVVILDQTVPGAMGGKDCLAELQAVDTGVRAIVSSGYSTDPIMADFANYGFAGVVAKPYQLHELSETVYGVLQDGFVQDAGSDSTAFESG